MSRMAKDRAPPTLVNIMPRAFKAHPRGVGLMLARGRVTQAQKDAADRFVALHERAQSDGMQAIDYTRERVDGTPAGYAFAHRVIDAKKKLEIVEAALGDDRYRLIMQTLVEGRSIRDIARARGSSHRQMLGREFVAALSVLDDLIRPQ